MCPIVLVKWIKLFVLFKKIDVEKKILALKNLKRYGII